MDDVKLSKPVEVVEFQYMLTIWGPRGLFSYDKTFSIFVIELLDRVLFHNYVHSFVYKDSCQKWQRKQQNETSHCFTHYKLIINTHKVIFLNYIFDAVYSRIESRSISYKIFYFFNKTFSIHNLQKEVSLHSHDIAVQVLFTTRKGNISQNVFLFNSYNLYSKISISKTNALSFHRS